MPDKQLVKVPCSPEWVWLGAQSDGADIIVRGTWGTYFGTPDDTEDNGIGAGGYHVKDNPAFVGCSLPQRRLLGQFRGCPIPKVPICGPNPSIAPGAIVQVFSQDTGKVVQAMVCDLGPSRSTMHGIDLTIGAVRALGLDPKKGKWRLDYRVLGAGR